MPGVLAAAETFLVQSEQRPTEEAFPHAWLNTQHSRDHKATGAPFHWHSAALMAEEVRERVTGPHGLGNVVRPAKLYSMQLV